MTACSSPSPNTPTLSLIGSVFCLFCHVESNHMKPHSVSPGGTSSSSTSLPVIFDTQTHTSSLLLQWQQASLTMTATHIYLFIFSHFPQTLDLLLFLSSACTLCCPWRFNAVNVEGIDAMVLPVSVCVSGGYFTFPFILYQTVNCWSEATLVFHERDGAFSKPPLRLTGREIRARGWKWSKG